MHHNQEKKPFHPPGSLKCPELEKLIMPAGKGEIVQDPTQAKKVESGSEKKLGRQ